MSLITIAGVVLPAPSQYKTGFQDLTKMDRNARGTMIGEFVARKVKIEMSWAYINASDLVSIFTAIDPLFFSVTYLDQQTNTVKVGTFYKGDRSVPLLDFLSDVPRYKDFAFNIIER